MRKVRVVTVVMAIALAALALTGCGDKVPNLVGMKQADAVRALEEEGFKLGEVSLVMTDTVPLGMIAAQSPAADERVRGDDTIDLAISFSDGKRVMVPTVGELEQVTAEQVATSLGLEPLVVDEYSEETVKGQVAAQSPSPGAEVDAGTTLLMVVSKGPAPEKAKVPDVVGDDKEDGKASLEKAGFVVEMFEVYDSEVAKGDIIGQEPEAGKSATVGSKVQFIASLGKGTGAVKVPSVVDDSEDDAIEDIEDAGLKVQKISQYNPDVKKGVVAEQFPESGSTAAKGSEVLIVVSKGAEPSSEVAVPDVQGETAAAATDALEEAGFVVTVQEVPSETGADSVVYQFPAAGTEAVPGSGVLIVIQVVQ